ncbi:hypothetical protein ACLKA6_000448 [Drosophila palustris]
MPATIDKGATRSFMSEDCVRWWAIQGETQIRLTDGSELEVVRSLKVDVGMTGKVVNMPLLIMPSLLDHVFLGMDFRCAMGTTVRCGNAELILKRWKTQLRCLWYPLFDSKTCPGESRRWKGGGHRPASSGS